MKKITHLLVILLIVTSGYSQENFDTPGIPDPLGPGPWVLPSGTWNIFDNGVGTINWSLNTTSIYPAHSGTTAAYIDRENIGDDSTSEKYLVTPAWNLPENPQLRFWTRTTIAIDNGTIFKVMACPASSDPTDPASYTVTLASWTEDDLTAVYNEYEEKAVDITGFAPGENIHIAFVKIFSQTGTGIQDERWLIDDVNLVSKCLDPTNIEISPESNSAAVSWDSSANASSWNVWVLPEGMPFIPANLGTPFLATTNEGFVVSQTSELPAANLVPTAEYVVYIQSDCGSHTSESFPSAPFFTKPLPPVCGGNFVDNGGPDGFYSGGAPEVVTICPELGSGEMVVVTFTTFYTKPLTDGLYVYNGMTVDDPLIASDFGPGDYFNLLTPGAFWGPETPGPFDSSSPTGCLTFQFISQEGSGGAGWIANVDCIPVPSCPKPFGLTTSSASDTTANLTWTSTVEPGNGFELLALPCGSPAPGPESVGIPFIPEAGDMSPYTFTYSGLTAVTCYDFWIRAKCSAEETGQWGVKETFTTPMKAPPCGGDYMDNGGAENNYIGGAPEIVTICPDAGSGEIAVVTFTSFETTASTDGLYVYDGISLNDPLIPSDNAAGFYANILVPGAYWGAQIPGPFNASGPSGCLTFRFVSQEWSSGPGWTATIECIPAPTCPKPAGLTAVSVSDSAVTLTWDSTVAPENGFELLALPCGSAEPDAAAVGIAFMPESGDTSPYTFTYPGLTDDSCFDFYVRAKCSSANSSYWGIKERAITQLTPPLCGETFVDNGGANGNYIGGFPQTVTICPEAGSADIVLVTFTSFNTLELTDGLYVYDGTDISAPLIPSDNGGGYYSNVQTPGAYWGSELPGPFNASTPSGCLTFQFMSQNNSSSAGWIANVTCIPAPTCPKPLDLTAVSGTDTTVTLTWASTVEPENGFELVAVACGSAAPASETVGIAFIPEAGDTSPYTFTYPALDDATCFDFWIRAKCSATETSLWGSKASYATIMTPPACGGQYVDTGGSSGNYLPDENTTVTICPELGEIVVVTFTAFNIQANSDGMLVYDGNSTSSPQIASDNPAGNGPLNNLPGAYWGTAIPGPFEATNALGCLTFTFISNGSNQAAGWEANVSCVPAPTCMKATGLTVTGATTDTTATVTWNANGTATTYNVYAIACGDPVPVGSDTPWKVINSTESSVTAILEGLDPSTCYQVYVISVCEGDDYSNPTAPKQVVTKISPPKCGELFTDPAGTMDYENGTNYSVSICPEQIGDVVVVTFTAFDIEANDDGMYIFDGATIDSPMIASDNPPGWNYPQLEQPGAYWGNENPGTFESSDPSGCLTFVFSSGQWGGTAPGWEATVSCVPAPACPKPAVLTLGLPTDTAIPVYWTNVGPATTWMVYAVECDSGVPTLETPGGQLATEAPTAEDPFIITGLSALSCYDVYVISVCSPTESSNPTGPKSITTAMGAPLCGEVFTDIGGASANYYESDLLLVICPENDDEVVTVAFTSFDVLPEFDGMYVYDGQDISAPLIASDNPAGFAEGLESPGAYWGNENPGIFEATNPDGCLTFQFFSGPWSGSNAGWEANVVCIPAPVCPKPVGLTLYEPTETTIPVSWTTTGPASQWVVVPVLCGSPVPTVDSPDGQLATIAPTPENPFVLTGLLPISCYEVYLFAICSATESSDPVVPKTTYTKVAIPQCGDIFTDEGGPDENYPLGSDWVVVICPDTDGDVVTVSFTEFITQAYYDGLYIYDGNSTSAPLIPSMNPAGTNLLQFAGAFWGDDLPGSFTSTSTDGCLTFRFLSEVSGSQAGWSATVNCGLPPSCPKPEMITVGEIGETSATVQWEEIGTAVQWQVLILPINDPAPDDSTIGWQTASSETLDYIGLLPSTHYKVYVRSVCAEGEFSAPSYAVGFATLISNDECSDAIALAVNADLNCAQITGGLLTGATSSSVAGCSGTFMDDVWFKFTATETNHSISFLNMVGTEYLAASLYSGDCDTLDCLSNIDNGGTVVTGLTPGQTYFIQFANPFNSSTGITSFDVCVGTPPPFVVVDNTNYTQEQLVQDVLFSQSCTEASNITSFTGTEFGSLYGIGYFNSNGSDFGIDQGVILSTCNVNNVAGPNDSMLHENVVGGTWAGDTEAAELWAEGVGFGEPVYGERNASSLEFDFTAANPSISFKYIFGSDGYGYAQCSNVNAFAFILTDLTENSDPVNYALVPDTTIPISEATIRNQVFNTLEVCEPANEMYFDDYYGFVSPLPPGTLNHLSAPTDFSGLTVPVLAKAPVIPGHDYHIKLVITKIFASKYDGGVFIGEFDFGQTDLSEEIVSTCDTSYQIQTGLDPETYTFEWTKNDEIINGEEGASLTVTESGVYAVNFDYIAGDCSYTDAVTVQFKAAPILDEVNDISQCGAYTVPVPALGHYYSQSGGAGEILDNTTIDQLGQVTLYLYAMQGECSAEKSFTVTLIAAPVLETMDDVSACGEYVLPVIQGVTYYNGTEASGGIITAVAQTQDVYAYMAGTAPNCWAEQTFMVTINGPAILGPIDDVVACGNYILPVVDGVVYYNGPGATAGTITTITQTQDVYAYMAGITPDCSAEQSFTVTISGPATLGPIEDVVSCGSYLLPVVDGVVYYSSAGAAGSAITTVVQTQDVYAYKAGITPDCSAEQSFTVTISEPAVLEPIADVVACGSYGLPAINGIVYYNGPGATGSAITTVTETQQVFAYMAGITPDCSAQESFMVTITGIQLAIIGSCRGNDYVLEADLSGNDPQLEYTYSWTTQDGQILSSGNEPIISISGEGTYNLMVAIGQDCNGQAQLAVAGTTCMIQKGISANGDGKNDVFDLDGFGVRKLEIYNRYGMKVYDRSPYTDQWSGQANNGDELPDGTYYYVIDFETAEPKTGWIYVNRKN